MATQSNPADKSAYSAWERAGLCLVPLLLLAVIQFWQLWVHGWYVHAEFPDSDTAMRLAYLKQVDATGDWAQGFFRRDNAPYGMFLHWSLPFNALLLGFVHLLRGTGIVDPWHAAGFFTGPLLRLAIVPVAWWAARAILSPLIACACVIALVLSPFIANYAMFGTANHHALIYGMTILLLGVWFRAVPQPGNDRLSLALGLLAGLCFWITFELGLEVALLLGFMALTWLRHGERSNLRQLTVCCAAFSLLVTAAWGLNPPYGGYGVITFDHLSLPYLAIAWGATAICAVAHYLPLPDTKARLRYGGIVGALFAIAWMAAFSQARYGIMGQDNASTAGILALPVELLPLATPAEFFYLLGPGLVAIFLCASRKYGIPHRLLLLPVLIGLSIAGYRYYRLVGHLVIASIFVIAYALDRLERQGAHARPNARQVLAGIAVLVVGADMVIAKLPVTPFPGYMPALCQPLTIESALNDPAWLAASSPEPIVATEMLYTPYLLYESQVRTVAGSYHRDTRGVLDLFGIFQAKDDNAPRRIVEQRGIQYVLVCETTPHIAYQHFSSARGPEPERPPQDTFYNRLVHRQPPAWLKIRPWPEGTKTGLLLYQVQPDLLKGTP